MRLEGWCVDRHDLLVVTLEGQPLDHPCKLCPRAPRFPLEIQFLERPALRTRVTPSQPVAIDENQANHQAFVIEARRPMALRAERLKLARLRNVLPE